MGDKIHRATAFTFDEDRVVIEAQYANMRRFPDAAPMGILADAPLNRARRIISRLSAPAVAAP
jgi:vanillate O-demethylase monooxygenase subunit